MQHPVMRTYRHGKKRYRLLRVDHEPVEAKAQLGLVPAREIPVYLEARK